MKSHDFLNENIVDDAAIMHQDHEVQMARKECYHSAENAIKIHQLLQQISEAQGLEGWVAAKITLASDYLTTVREYLEYQAISGHPVIAEALNFNDKKGKWEWDDGTYVDPDELTPAQKQRIQQWKADNPGKRPSKASVPDTREPARGFGGRVFEQGVAEAYEEYDDIDDDDEEENDGFYVVIASEDSGVFVGALTKDGGRWRETTVKGNKPHNWGGGYMSYLTPEEVMSWLHKDYGRSYEVAGPFYDDQDVEDYANSLMENSAGCVAGVVNANGMGKKKAEIGSLFGGTYKTKKAKK